MYITTSDSVLGADWSSATITCDNSVYHVNEKISIMVLIL